MGRIAHIGLGNFARAHLCDYTQDAGGWGITGVSLRSAAVRDGLAAQDYVYNLCVMGSATRKIDCVQEVLVAPEDPEAVLSLLGTVDLISITVTEKGYHLTPTSILDFNDPLIQADLQGDHPQTLIGYLAHGLVRRKDPVTVLSCDNRVENGAVLERAVRDFAKAAQVQINWDAVSFPNAMVDRITPATTDALRTKARDPMAVPTEAFREWVIEDRFQGPRPDWPDVQFVEDVAPHEKRKLRMLNGAHSFLAYAGTLAGHQYVHEAIANPLLRSQVIGLMEEAAATLPIEVQRMTDAYAQALVHRFENPDLAHSLRQIAMDGSEKIPYRLAASLRDLIAQGRQPRHIPAALRAWVAFCVSETQAGRALDDPKADDLARAGQSANPLRSCLIVAAADDLIDWVEQV